MTARATTKPPSSKRALFPADEPPALADDHPELPLVVHLVGDALWVHEGVTRANHARGCLPGAVVGEKPGGASARVLLGCAMARSRDEVRFMSSEAGALGAKVQLPMRVRGARRIR